MHLCKQVVSQRNPARQKGFKKANKKRGVKKVLDVEGDQGFQINRV